MVHFDRFTVSTIPADELNPSISSRANRRSRRRGIVYSAMRAGRIENWMFAAQIEPRTYAGEIYRRALKRLAHGIATVRIVGGMPLVEGVKNSA